MKIKYYFIFIVFIIISSCISKENKYKIINRTKIIRKGNCKIHVSYPEITGLKQKQKQKNLNSVLENLPEHEYYASSNCKDKNSVNGEYQVLLSNDSILSVEFRTIIKWKNRKTDTIFKTLVLNPNKENDNELTAIELKQIIPNFERGLIFPYVEKYEKNHNAGINLLAYKTGSKYVITWSISDKYLNVYVGDEGEWSGYHKIKIPLNEIKK